MVTTAARERLARSLGRDTKPAAASAELRAPADDLRLEVDGIGRVRFPVTARQARLLRELGRPARFGRGEETLTDPKVAIRGRSRGTWCAPSEIRCATGSRS